MIEETKVCTKCGMYKPISAFSLAYKGMCKDCRNEIEKEKRNIKDASRAQADNAKSSVVDWEKRKYDLASDLFARMMVEYNKDNDKFGFRAAIKNVSLLKGKSEVAYLSDTAIGEASYFIERYKAKSLSDEEI